MATHGIFITAWMEIFQSFLEIFKNITSNHQQYMEFDQAFFHSQWEKENNWNLKILVMTIQCEMSTE